MNSLEERLIELESRLSSVELAVSPLMRWGEVARAIGSRSKEGAYMKIRRWNKRNPKTPIKLIHGGVDRLSFEKNWRD